MVTYTASDIIKQAKILGNVLNINMTNFDLATTLLNTEYQKLYDKIVMANGANIKTIEMTQKPFLLPEDCYHIIDVKRNNKSLRKSSVRQSIPGTYKIENEEIICEASSITLKYSLLPETITAPDKPIKLDINIKECGQVTEDGFYYKDDKDVSLFYSFSDNESVEKPFKEQSKVFLDHDLDFINGKIYYNVTDVTYLFKRDDADIKSVVTSDPYTIVNYSDNTSYIFYGFEGSDQLNYNESKGKKTLGQVLGFTTNDLTGRGCIWQDISGDIYLTSFTPDTVLNYPSNTFFQLLIYRLAAVLQSMNGTLNQYLTDVLLPEAQVAFEEHLDKDNLVTNRMNNVI